MPLVARRHTREGQEAITNVFASQYNFNQVLERLVAKVCNRVLGTELEAGLNVKIEGEPYVSSGLPVDIGIGLTMWKGPDWPDTAELTPEDQLMIKYMVEEGIEVFFAKSLDSPTIQVEVTVFG